MKLEQSFEVRAPVERVWETLVDVERVAPCLPGAEITEAGDDGTYRGTFSVRLGPTTAAYRGELSMEELDEAARRVVMRASGQDKRGQGSAKATIVSTMRAEGDVTRVDVETDFTITGRLARFGRGGMIQDISNRLLRDFADCLQAEDRGAARRRAEPDRRRARRNPGGRRGAARGRGGSDARRPPSRSAASRSSSARYSTGCGGCSAAADASAPRSQPGSSRRKRRVDRVRHRRLAVGHVGARLGEPVARVAPELDRDHGVVGAVADRHRQPGGLRRGRARSPRPRG